MTVGGDVSNNYFSPREYYGTRYYTEDTVIVGVLLNSPVPVAVHLSAMSLPWTQPCVVLNWQSMSVF